MNALKLKICGMKHPENIQETASLNPDYLGFIFYERSPRNFSGEIPEIDSAIKKTGVFVDAELDFILEKIKKYDLKAIQLHGSESSEFCSGLKNLVSVEIIKVFSIQNSFEFEKLQEYEGIVDFFLFDTQGKNKGGNGITFNWDVLKKYPSTTPFFLSGGIGLDEIPEIIELQNYFEKQNKSKLLFALDVNSKFEIEAGLKDSTKLKIFKDTLGFNSQL